MKQDLMNLPVDVIETYLSDIFMAYKAPEETAKIVSEHLVYANLTGHDSHGVLRAPWYMEKIESGDIDPLAQCEIENETKNTGIVNGNWGFGQPACLMAMKLAIEKARTENIACVTVKNANHVGRIGSYTELASQENMIGMGGCNLHGSSHCVAPFGGIDRKLPTNPFSVSAPTGKGSDFLLDMTSSVVAEGKLQVFRNKGLEIPEGWIIDNAGNSSTQPWDFYNEPKGALLPMGGVASHKGFGISMAMDILSGGLSGAECTNAQGKRHGNACWFIAINIEPFVEMSHFLNNIQSLIDHVKDTRKMPGVAEVMYAGEPESKKHSALINKGINLENVTWTWLQEKAESVGVPSPL